MRPLDPRAIAAGTEEQVLKTKNGRPAWVDAAAAVADPAAAGPGDVLTIGPTGTPVWSQVMAREVLMATGVTPPEPLVSSDGYDWIYGEVAQ